MNQSHCDKNNHERGQALIIIMLVLVIAAIVATGLSVRTISDIQRVGQERASVDAFAYAESALEDASKEIDYCLSQQDKAPQDCLLDLCGDVEKCEFTCKKGSICEFLAGFEQSECSELTLGIFARKEIDSRKISKDEVVEYYVGNQYASIAPLTIEWAGENILLTFISKDATNRYFVSESSGKLAYSHEEASVPVDNFTANNGTISLASASFSGVEALRIRAIGGQATISITGFKDVAEFAYLANGYCGGVSRSEVWIESTREGLDGIFDHALYSNVIEKDLE